MVNMLERHQAVSLSVPGGWETHSFEAFRTSAHESFDALQDLQAHNGGLNYTAPPLSVTTLTASRKPQDAQK